MNQQKIDPSRPSIATSRRNFAAGATVLMGALLVPLLRPTRANADHNHPSGRACDGPGQGDGRGHCICFLRGTRLNTPNGEIAIENLRVGDLVTTASGASRPVKWLAKMRHEREVSEHWQHGLRPIRIRARALDPQTPTRDLFVSGAHLMYFDDVLIAASDLVNGTSIIREDAESCTVLEYFHVELETHDILIAEGAAAESLQATSISRLQFDNYDEFVRLYGDDAPDLCSCAPVVGYYGGRGEVASRWRSLIAPVIDIREPLEIARDRIDNLALRRAA